MALARGLDNGILNPQCQGGYAACSSVLTIPWRRGTVSQGRNAPA